MVGTQSTAKTNKTSNRLPKPTWYDSAPTNPRQTHTFDNRTWHWCPKCGSGGKWVCTHTPAQHTDNYIKKRRSDNSSSGGDKRPSPSPEPQANMATGINAENLAQLVAEQVATQLHARRSFHRPTATMIPPPPPGPPAPTAHLAQPASAPALTQLVADQVHHQLQAHFASTNSAPMAHPPYTAPLPGFPNNDILDW